ncbi:MAG: DUF4292 domain-containing protein [Mangrovimonas sp.]|nr:DUF4292 domain-containing protein [Mangrovimonas sp.]
MNYPKYIFGLFFLLGVVGCKSSRTLTSTSTNFSLSKKQVIKEHQKLTPNFKTLQSKIKIDYKRGDDEHSYSATLRIEKDKAIWINSTLSVVRVMITPDRVSFYNKLDNTYFDGDFSYLSDLLGTQIDFTKAQNILLGETVYDLKQDDYVLSTHEKSYLLQPKEQKQLFEIFFLINPAHFRLDSQQVAQNLEQRMMEVDYITYQEVGKQVFPEKLKVYSVEKSNETIIGLEFKSITLNEDLNFPYKIPSGFKQLEL